MTAIEVIGLERIQRKLKNVNDFQKWGNAPMEEAVELVYETVIDQPEKHPTAFANFATPAQRRAYWAKVRSREAQHGSNGYIRSNRLKRGWKKQVARIAKGLEGTVSNAVPYAKFVQKKGSRPTFIRRSFWETTDTIAKKLTKRVNRIFADAISKELKK